MNKKVMFALVLILAVIIATAVFVSNRSEAPSTPEQSQSQYSLEEVSTHNKFNDCWTIINSGVYDITSYVPIHPGGEEILRTCGVDGTNMFTERKTDTGEIIGSGTPHSSAAEQQLADYKIGELAQ